MPPDARGGPGKGPDPTMRITVATSATEGVDDG
jgi:hypothetical protein